MYLASRYRARYICRDDDDDDDLGFRARQCAIHGEQ